MFQLLMGKPFDDLVAAASWYEGRVHLASVCQWSIGKLLWQQCYDEVQVELVERMVKTALDELFGLPDTTIITLAKIKDRYIYIHLLFSSFRVLRLESLDVSSFRV